MASSSEVGHIKNATNFSTGIQILEEMGTLYNPSNANILIDKLSPINTAIQATLQTLSTQYPMYKNAVAAREVAIAPLSKTSTKIGNYAKSLQISDQDKENINAAVKKVRGDTKTKKINPEITPTDEISTSQMSYDSRIENLRKLQQLVGSHSAYNPNESDITIQTIEAYHTNLKALSTAVNTAANKLITGRAARNQILYHADNSILELVTLIKAYLKSLGDAAKPYYKAFVKLKFKEITS